MTKCSECGAPTAEYCTRWDCPELQWLSVPIPEPALRFQCYKRIVEGVRMNSPLDWDYADLKRRMDNLRPPPYKSGSGVVGNHCDHCPTDPSKHCLVSCSLAYRNRYGVEPQ